MGNLICCQGLLQHAGGLARLAGADGCRRSCTRGSEMRQKGTNSKGIIKMDDRESLNDIVDIKVREPGAAGEDGAGSDDLRFIPIFYFLTFPG